MTGKRTISDIAAKAKVSTAAVSYALNGKPGISEQTRRHILRVADELQWEPNSHARNLAGATAHAVGLVWTRNAKTIEDEGFPGRFLSGLSGGLRSSKMSLLMAVEYDPGAELELYRAWYRRKQVDAVILLNLVPADPRMALLDGLGVPYVLAGEPEFAQRHPYTYADDAVDMETIVSAFAQRGVRRFAHVMGTAELLFGRRRQEAYLNALAARGLSDIGSLPAPLAEAEAVADVTRKLIRRRHKPEVIIYDSDTTALWGQRALLDAGLDVGHDVSVVGFDDSFVCRYAGPSISALDRHPEQLGYFSAELAIRTDLYRVLKVDRGVLNFRESTRRWADPIPD